MKRNDLDGGVSPTVRFLDSPCRHASAVATAGDDPVAPGPDGRCRGPLTQDYRCDLQTRLRSTVTGGARNLCAGQPGGDRAIAARVDAVEHRPSVDVRAGRPNEPGLEHQVELAGRRRPAQPNLASDRRRPQRPKRKQADDLPPRRVGEQFDAWSKSFRHVGHRSSMRLGSALAIYWRSTTASAALRVTLSVPHSVRCQLLATRACPVEPSRSCSPISRVRHAS